MFDTVTVPEWAPTKVVLYTGKRDSVQHHLLEVMFETATVPVGTYESLYTPPPLGGGGGI